MKNLARKALAVTLACTGVNLVLGLLYSWSVIARFLREIHGFTAVESQIPYMIACGIFAILMVPGGRLQDKIGPKYVIMFSGIFAGIGLIVSSFVITVVGLSIFFGVVFGTAIGLGYASATPPVMKWYGPEKRGLVTGIVVAGFGCASVYAAPLTNFLIENFGLTNAFLFLGTAFLILILLLAQLISDPPYGYNPANGTLKASQESIAQEDKEEQKKSKQKEFEWYEMLRTPQFYMLWFMFFFGALGGLMIIGQLSSIALEQAGVELGFILVAVLAVFNASGRIIAGTVSDKIGRANTMLIIFVAQALNFMVFSMYTGMGTLILGAAITGFCYGACLSVFPAATADLFGVKNLGVNYGLVFTSWGAGGVFGGLVGGIIRDLSGAYLGAYLVAAVLCVIGAGLTFLIRSPMPADIKTEHKPKAQEKRV